MCKVSNQRLFIMFQDFSSHISKFLSTAKLKQNRRKGLSLARHRLDDNLHWRCGTCHSVVPTHETHLHLSSCLDYINSTESEDPILSPLSDQEFDRKLLCIEIKPMDRHQRPRTKKLERPTPNLKHPVINGNLSEESKQNFNDKLFANKNNEKSLNLNEKTNKSQTTSLEKAINKTAEKTRDQTICEKNSRSPCKTCDREIAPEKFHCHNTFSLNKTPVLRRSKTEETTGASPSATLTALTCHKANTIKNNFQSKSTDSTTQYKAKTELKLSNENLRCNICKSSYTATNISAHEQQCLKAIRGNNITKSINDTEVQPINKDGCDPAGWEHFKSQLVPCSRCFRTFFPHRLPIHEKSCRGITIKQTTKPAQESKVHIKANIPTKSTFLDCTTCGRKYSTTSLTLHELKCRTNNNNRKLNTGKCDNMNEMNIAWEHFKTQLVPCTKCKRKFLPDRLEKHEPNCKADPIISTTNK